MPDTCAVPICDRPQTKRSWCEAHYTRWRKTGDTGNEPVRAQRKHRYQRGICSVSECGREEHCKSYCSSHYIKLRKTGAAGDKPLAVQAKAIDHTDGTRTCSSCDERKPLSSYYKSKLCALGHRATCIKCCRMREGLRRAEVPDTYTAIYAAKRARKASALVDAGISHGALRARDGDQCYYCETTMDFTPGKLGVWNPIKASIEHLMPLSRGGAHSFDNTVLACLQCNVRKHAKTEEEWLSKAG
jgi:hypothetical protein